MLFRATEVPASQLTFVGVEGGTLIFLVCNQAKERTPARRSLLHIWCYQRPCRVEVLKPRASRLAGGARRRALQILGGVI